MCPTVEDMGTLQIRNVPEDVRTELKARAASAGQSLSEYLLAEVTKVARRPTLDEVKARIAARGTVDGLPSASEMLAEARRLG